MYAQAALATDDEGYATVNVPGFADSVTIKNDCPKDVSASTGFIDLTGDQLCSDEEDGVKTGRSLSVADSFRATDAHKYTVDSPMVFYELTKRKVKVMLGVGIVEPFVVQDDDASSDTHAIYDAAMNAANQKMCFKEFQKADFFIQLANENSKCSISFETVSTTDKDIPLDLEFDGRIESIQPQESDNDEYSGYLNEVKAFMIFPLAKSTAKI